MKISVIVPTYKPKDYLWECLDSMYNQTLPYNDFEVVIVLNGCKEPYYTNIWKYINEHPKINWRYLHTDEGGVSNARNMGLDAAKGDYITFLDDDDYFSNVTLERLLDKATSKDVVIFKPLAFEDGTQDFFEYSRSYEYNFNKDKVDLPYYKVRRNFGGPVMKLFPRSIIGERRYDLSFKNGEDSLFMFLISDRMKNVNFAKEDAIYYRRVRQNSAATSSRSFRSVFFNSCRLSFEYTKIYLSNPWNYKVFFYLTRILGSIRAVINYRNITF